MVGVAQVVRAPGCDPGGRGFESPRPPSYIEVPSTGPVDAKNLAEQAPLAQLAEHRTLNPQVLGSSPRGRTKKDQVGGHTCLRAGVKESEWPIHWPIHGSDSLHVKITTRRRPSYWELRVSLGRYSATGKAEYKPKNLRATKREAQWALASLVAQEAGRKRCFRSASPLHDPIRMAFDQAIRGNVEDH